MKKHLSKKGIVIICITIIGIVGLTIGVLIAINRLVLDSVAKYSNSETKAEVENTYVPIATTIPEDSSTILEPTKDAGREYQDSTLYLGDSNTVRFMNANDIDGQPFTTDQNTIAVVGMGVQAIDSLRCEQLESGTYTMVESVSLLQPQRIIITFGTNNLDGITFDPTGFITEYTKQLKEIQEAYPSIDIIVNSIPPFSSNTTYTKLKPDQVKEWNKALQIMCYENDWKYLNSYEALCDDTGYIRDGYTVGDGLHLSPVGITSLFRYIRTHAYITEDERSQPLSDIPTIYGPVTNIYSLES